MFNDVEILLFEGEKFNFECYDNNEPIEIGDYFIFNFGGQLAVDKCSSEGEKKEINPNNVPRQENVIDFVYGFWKSCYKIKETNFPLEEI